LPDQQRQPAFETGSKNSASPLGEKRLADMLRAFPQLPLSAQPSAYISGEQQANWALDARMLELYRILGLIERNPEQAEFHEADKQTMQRTVLFETLFVRA